MTRNKTLRNSNICPISSFKLHSYTEHILTKFLPSKLLNIHVFIWRNSEQTTRINNVTIIDSIVNQSRLKYKKMK
uniref:CSON008663 protein n=1 Tax=Culicoides sonorensis TaxID=179676 RepID=A0A336LK27_CULSO